MYKLKIPKTFRTTTGLTIAINSTHDRFIVVNDDILMGLVTLKMNNTYDFLMPHDTFKTCFESVNQPIKRNLPDWF